MPILLLCLALVVLAPVSAAAQNASPTGPTQIKVVAVGGFLGQLDGFCEPPGSTADLDFIKRPDVLSCAGADGRLQKDKWPVAMGGLLGAGALITNERRWDQDTLVLIPGNNQVANFTFLDRQKLLQQTKTFATVRAVVDDSQSKADATLGRFQRFWQDMSDLDVDAIGLATEDFVRSLRDPRDDDSTTVKDRGSILHRWLRLATQDGNKLPIIGSNVVIKMSQPGTLNDVKKGGFSLVGIDKSSSIGWMTKVTVAHPARAGIDIELWEAGPVGADDAERFVSTTATKAVATTELDIVDGTLRPGYRYQVRSRDGSERAILTFQTHTALTPHKNDLGNLDGFPVVTKTLADGSPLLILSLVDPGVKGLLGDAWKWDQGNKGCVDGDYCDWSNQTCAAERCEIDFMSPADAVTAAIRRSFVKPTDRKPFIILLSALTDTQTEELLEQFPEIRLIVLDPETYMLGRGSREYGPELKPELDRRLSLRKDTTQKYGGDLGMFSVVTSGRPQMTTLMARAEWIGEWAAKITGTVRYSDQFEWEITRPEISVEPIPGAALTWADAPCQDAKDKAAKAECTSFSVHVRDQTGKTETKPYGLFVSYQVCEGKLGPQQTPQPTPTLVDQCDLFSNLLKNGDFMALAGDAFRRATGSELAIVPGTLIDPDAQAWLEPILTRDTTRVMTRLVLERAIFRSFRIVRATVAGDQLVTKLAEALKIPVYPRTCVLGIDGGCTTTVDPKKPDQVLANGRLIDSRSFYTIAMPEGMATELKLPHSKKSGHTTDAVSALHQRLVSDDENGGWYVSGQRNTLAPRIESRARNSIQFRTLLSSLEVGYADYFLDPDPRDLSDAGRARTKQLSGLDVEFTGVKPSTKWTGKADLDIALDSQFVALRGIFNADLSRRLDYKATGNELVFDKNTFTRGWRIDAKLPAFKREVRPYIGKFLDGEIMGSPEYRTAKYTDEVADGFKKTTTAARPTQFDREPRRYHYRAYGIDVLNVWKIAPASKHPVDIKKFAIQYATGEINRVIGATVEGSKQEGDWSALGAQGVIDAYFNAHRDDFTPDVMFKSQEELRDQDRWQAEASLEPRLILGARTWKFGMEFRYRRFPQPSELTDLSDYFKAKLSWSLPITARVEFVPSYEYHQAHVHDPAALPFRHTKIEATVKLPVAVLGGIKWPGWLVQ